RALVGIVVVFAPCRELPHRLLMRISGRTKLKAREPARTRTWNPSPAAVAGREDGVIPMVLSNSSKDPARSDLLEIMVADKIAMRAHVRTAFPGAPVEQPGAW
ncbi:hypothetical protein ACWGTI_32820, partial [Mesorhizobium sp. ArgA1]